MPLPDSRSTQPAEAGPPGSALPLNHPTVVPPPPLATLRKDPTAPERPLRLALLGEAAAGRSGPHEPLPESALKTTLPYGDVAVPGTVSVDPLAHVEQWDRYEFIRLLGCGGMGEVYQARDRRLQRIVALKFIRLGSPEMNVRLAQEARAQARIDHPYVCKVYEVGELAGQAYIVMQYIDGTPLDTAVASSSLSMMDKLVLIQKVAIAIHEAHKLGIIHRNAHSEFAVEKSS